MSYKSQERKWKARSSYAVVAWCVVFGILHLYWAVGGNAGLAQFSTPSNQTAALMRDPIYIGMTWGVFVVCMYGAIIALASIQAWGRHIPRWIVLSTLWIACGLCLVRGFGNPIQTLLLIWGVIPAEALGGPLTQAWYQWMLVDSILFSPWFTLGGVVFGVTAWSAGRVVTKSAGAAW